MRIKNYQQGRQTSDRTDTSDLTQALSYLQGRQVTSSEAHPYFVSRKPGVFAGDQGGDFITTKRYVEGKTANVSFAFGGGDWYNSYQGNYRGPMLPLPPNQLLFPPFSHSSADALGEKGATAIARCSPSNPIVDLTTAIGEFTKEGLPRLLGSALRSWKSMLPHQRRKAIGDEYLNYQFGWKPLANDLGTTAAAIVDHDALIEQYVRDSGRMVRRRFEFPDKKSSRQVMSKGSVDPWISPSSSYMYDWTSENTGKVVLFEEFEQKTWFSGAFTYYVPDRGNSTLKDNMAREVILARHAYGIQFTPEAVWNLAPWTWLLDWFGNAGDVLHNFSAFAIDGQVLKYGYIMEHTVTKWTYTWQGKSQLRTSRVPEPITLVSESKVRKQANPYGFGISFDGLSAFQKSILAALGLSKGGKR